MPVDKQAIYDALDPSWWTVSMPNYWQTSFLSTNILFENSAGLEMTYTSSMPYLTYGLNAGGNTTTFDDSTGYPVASNAQPVQRTNDGVNTLETLVNGLRTQASQRLYDMHATAIIGNESLASVYGAQA